VAERKKSLNIKKTRKVSMKKINAILGGAIISLTAYAGIEFCQYTMTSECRESETITGSCPFGPAETWTIVYSGAQSYTHCEMIGYGEGNRQCRNVGDPFSCEWTVTITDCDYVVTVYTDGFPWKIQPTEAGGGAGC